MPVGDAMPQSEHPIIKARRDQMFPVLEPAEIGNGVGSGSEIVSCLKVVLRFSAFQPSEAAPTESP